MRKQVSLVDGQVREGGEPWHTQAGLAARMGAAASGLEDRGHKTLETAEGRWLILKLGDGEVLDGETDAPDHAVRW